MSDGNDDDGENALERATEMGMLLMQQIEELELENSQLTESKSRVQAELDRSKMRVSQLERVERDSEQQAKAFEQERGEWARRVFEVQEENETICNQILRKGGAATGPVTPKCVTEEREKELTRLRAEVKQQHAQITSLQEVKIRNEVASEKEQALNSSLEEREAELATLREEFAAQQTQIDELLQTKERDEEMREKHASEREELDKKNESLQMQCEHFRSQISELQQSMDRSGEELQRYVGMNEDQQAKIEKMQLSKVDLKDQVSKLQQKLDCEIEQRQSLQERQEQLQKEDKASASERQESQKLMENTIQHLKSRQTDMSALVIQTQWKATKDRTRLKEAERTWTDRLKKVEEDLANSTEECQRLNEENERLEEKECKAKTRAHTVLSTGRSATDNFTELAHDTGLQAEGPVGEESTSLDTIVANDHTFTTMAPLLRVQSAFTQSRRMMNLRQARAPSADEIGIECAAQSPQTIQLHDDDGVDCGDAAVSSKEGSRLLPTSSEIYAIAINGMHAGDSEAALQRRCEVQTQTAPDVQRTCCDVEIQASQGSSLGSLEAEVQTDQSATGMGSEDSGGVGAFDPGADPEVIADQLDKTVSLLLTWWSAKFQPVSIPGSTTGGLTALKTANVK